VLGKLAVEGGVPRTAEQLGAGVQHRGVGRHRRIQAANELGVALVVGPADPERPRSAAQPTQGPGIRGRQGGQDAGPSVEHQPSRSGTGEQRDLRVVVLDGQRGAVGQCVAADSVDLDHL
jgi:hypothetical protein